MHPSSNCHSLSNTNCHTRRYFSFYGATRGNVLNNLACEDPAVNAARMLLALTMVFVSVWWYSACCARG